MKPIYSLSKFTSAFDGGQLNCSLRFLAALILFPLVTQASPPGIEPASFSSSDKKLWHKAEDHFTYGEYDQALPFYKQLAVKYPNDWKMNYHYGVSLYYSTTSRPLSIPYLEKAVTESKKDTVPDLVYHLGLAYLSVDRFAD